MSGSPPSPRLGQLPRLKGYTCATKRLYHLVRISTFNTLLTTYQESVVARTLILEE